MIIRKIVYSFVFFSLLISTEAIGQKHKGKSENPSLKSSLNENIIPQVQQHVQEINDTLKSLPKLVMNLQTELSKVKEDAAKPRVVKLLLIDLEEADFWYTVLALAVPVIIWNVWITMLVIRLKSSFAGFKTSARTVGQYSGQSSSYGFATLPKTDGANFKSAMIEKDTLTPVEKENIRTLIRLLSGDVLKQILSLVKENQFGKNEVSEEPHPPVTEIIPRRFFLSAPTIDRKFFDESKKTSFDPLKSLYLLEVNQDGNDGIFSLFTDSRAIQRALENEELAIKPVCEKTKDSSLSHGRNIENIESGRVSKKGNMWIVEKKARIKVT
jgi:hypothetical protein